jgi:outer membrane protein assembly factor BamA
VGLTDVLGDQLFTFTAYSVREFRTYDFRYVNLASRLHYGLDFFDTTSFYYAAPYGLTGPAYGYYGRVDAIATQRFTGLQAFAEYPLDKFRRLNLGAGIIRVNEQYENPELEAIVCGQAAALGVSCFLNNGWQAPISVALVQETTRFAEFGPLSGSTYHLGFRVAPGVSGLLGRQTVDMDLRKYLRLGSTTSLLALRGRGFYSTGDNPDYFYFGGNMELRGYPYLGFAGNQGFFANAEFRFPVIHLAATPLGLIGPVRGTVYFGIGGAKFKGAPYTFSSSEPGISYINDPIFGEPVSGWHLVDGRASYGFGAQLFFLGYPLHFDWTKFTDFGVTSDSWEFSFWIGYDF